MRASNKNSVYYQVADYYDRLEHKEKFIGRRPISLRSSYEIKYAQFLDLNPSVLEWKSEDVIIKYWDSTTKKNRRYFVDFWMKVKDADGIVKEFLVEVKPLNMLKPPRPPKRKTAKYRNRVRQYIVNECKFEAARNVCQHLRDTTGRDIEFIIITEKELGI